MIWDGCSAGECGGNNDSGDSGTTNGDGGGSSTGSGGGSSDGSSCDTNGNSLPDIPCPGLHTRDWNDWFNRSNGSDALCPPGTPLVECYYAHASLNMGEDPLTIDFQEFQDLLLAIYDEVDGRNGVDLYMSSINFDTPFYDLGSIGKTGLPGTGCINGLGCYARSELNYVAQGELAAAAGQSREAGFLKVLAWKATLGGFRSPSPGTNEMYNIGYDFYHAQNGSSPPPYRTIWLPLMVP
jgi:hypothetical protein